MESFPEGLMRLGGFVFRAERDTLSSTTLGRSFHILEVPNGNNLALVGPVYAPSVVHHRGHRALMR